MMTDVKNGEKNQQTAEKPSRKWITFPSDGLPHIAVFRKLLTVKNQQQLTFEYTADERCQIFLDGTLITEGPERGSEKFWYKQPVEITLTPGDHFLCIRLLAFGYPLTAWGQVTISHGFGFENSSIPLTDGWEYQFEACEWFSPQPNWGGFAAFRMMSDYNFDLFSGCGGIWKPAVCREDHRELHSPDLPPMLQEEITEYEIFHEGNRVVVRFPEYELYRAEFDFAGCGDIEIRYAEAPFAEPAFSLELLKGYKGKRDGNIFICDPEIVRLDGAEHHYWDYHYRCGRFLIFDCYGSAQVKQFHFYRCHYPLKKPIFGSGIQPRWERALNSAWKTLCACSWETFFDCPYFDQIMYTGDSYPEAVSLYPFDTECRLPEKALKLLATGQNEDGSYPPRYPCRSPELNGGIPSYSMYYLLMLYDHALWRNNPDFTASLLPAARKTVEYVRSTLGKDGLWRPGKWLLIDWSIGWPANGAPLVPTGSSAETNSILNLLASLGLKRLAELEEWCGSSREAKSDRILSDILYESVMEHYYSSAWMMLANDLDKNYFSEHPQILALLIQPNEDLRRALQYQSTVETGVFFSHLYFEACYHYGLNERFYKRMLKWCDLIDNGLLTVPEEFSAARSDCHAWGSHILYHYFASVKGRRPEKLGSSRMTEKPLIVPPGAEFDLFRETDSL